MYEFIIEESGYPKRRPTLKEFQEQFNRPLKRLLEMLPGTHVLEGCNVAEFGNGQMEITAGLIAHEGQLWTVEHYYGVPVNTLSLLESVEQAQFNVGTREAQNIQPRNYRYLRVAQAGLIANRQYTVNIEDLYRQRKFVEYFDRGRTYLGTPPINVDRAANTYLIQHDYSYTSDYFVIGKFKRTNGDSIDASIDYWITEESANNFKLNIAELFRGGIVFEWMIIASNKEYVRRTRIN